MEKIYFFAVILFASFLMTDVAAQTPLDRYIETGKTIVIAKCLVVGPVDILLRADVQVQILYVVKGKETLREIRVKSQYGMTVGMVYLLRTEYEAVADRPYFRVDNIDSVIPVSPSEEIEKLKTLSPRIVVLRTMNVRVDRLETDIERYTFELEALKKARRDN